MTIEIDSIIPIASNAGNSEIVVAGVGDGLEVYVDDCIGVGSAIDDEGVGLVVP